MLMYMKYFDDIVIYQDKIMDQFFVPLWHEITKDRTRKQLIRIAKKILKISEGNELVIEGVTKKRDQVEKLYDRIRFMPTIFNTEVDSWHNNFSDEGLEITQESYEKHAELLNSYFAALIAFLYIAGCMFRYSFQIRYDVAINLLNENVKKTISMLNKENGRE